VPKALTSVRPVQSGDGRGRHGYSAGQFQIIFFVCFFPADVFSDVTIKMCIVIAPFNAPGCFLPIALFLFLFIILVLIFSKKEKKE